MKNPFKRKPKQQTVVELVNSSLGSVEYRQDERRVAIAREVLSRPEVAEMLAVMALESPIKTAPLPPGSSAEDIARAYGIEHGYQHYHAKLLSLGVSAAQTEEPKIEFKDELETE